MKGITQIKLTKPKAIKPAHQLNKYQPRPKITKLKIATTKLNLSFFKKTKRFFISYLQNTNYLLPRYNQLVDYTYR